eukprot:TRINITY_DN6636_c1_g1_i2.p2 TRINITY_DN6636_c1_g1~~TRINITY_DN6636_c1_g1_i2.p2  ORF type:complete len:296 (-),score=-8.41 TRINITY_DN6636_c1_g1_i2:1213-2100(-)
MFFLNVYRIQLLEEIGQQKSWSLRWSNMCQSYQEQMNHVSFQSYYYNLDINFNTVLLSSLFASSMVFCILYIFAHYLLNRFIPRYNQYGQGEQLVATTCVITCITFTILVVPFTFVTILFVFGNPIKVFVQQKWFLAIMLSSIIMLHFYESVIRTVVKPNITMIIHHLGFLFYSFRIAINPTFFGFKLAVIILWMLVYNNVKDLGHIFYMFYRGEQTRLIQYTIIVGLLLNTIVKILGVIMAIYTAACSDAKKDVISFFVPVALITFFVVIQVYVYKPFIHMIYNAGKPREGQNN